MVASIVSNDIALGQLQVDLCDLDASDAATVFTGAAHDACEKFRDGYSGTLYTTLNGLCDIYDALFQAFEAAT